MTSVLPHLEKLSSATGAAGTAIGAAAGLFSENTSTSRLAAVAGAAGGEEFREEELPIPSRSVEEAATC